jgi:ArsR family transcriptional regulator, arsenate/arsenite/antimonite-responsive transcriptional repressor
LVGIKLFICLLLTISYLLVWKFHQRELYFGQQRNDVMKESTTIFKALSDKNRLRILKMLQIKPLCVCEITEILQLAASTVSQHLSILKKEGFILEDRDGKWVNYSINQRPGDQRISAILSQLDFWLGDSQLIDADKQKVKVVDRIEVCGR